MNKKIRVMEFDNEKILEQYAEKTYFNVNQVSGNSFQIEPTGYKGEYLDGMAILFDGNEYEVIEYQAGKKQNELHVFYRSKSLKRALNNMLKGNKRPKSECLEIWN